MSRCPTLALIAMDVGALVDYGEFLESLAAKC